MYYYGARYYDPKLSIWMSVDPLALDTPGVSPYTYCLNNPINLQDKDGRIIDLSSLTPAQLQSYKATIKRLSNSRLFNYYYNKLVKSDKVYKVDIVPKVYKNGKEIGGKFNPLYNKVTLNEKLNGFIVAQELFHAFQKDGEFYQDRCPSPDSTIEAEADIMATYVVIESGEGMITMNDWMDEIVGQAYSKIPTSQEVKSPEYQKMFQNGVNNRIHFYSQSDIKQDTYTQDNTVERPKAIEATLEGCGC